MLHLTRANQTPNPGTALYQQPPWNTCRYVDSSNSVSSQCGCHWITGQYSCTTTTNLVYRITCQRCGLLDIGDTKPRLADRFTEHLPSVRIKQPALAVALHFNALPRNCDECAWVVSTATDAAPKELEQHLIYKLGMLSPGGLNVELSASRPQMESNGLWRKSDHLRNNEHWLHLCPDLYHPTALRSTIYIQLKMLSKWEFILTDSKYQYSWPTTVAPESHTEFWWIVLKWNSSHIYLYLTHHLSFI